MTRQYSMALALVALTSACSYSSAFVPSANTPFQRRWGTATLHVSTVSEVDTPSVGEDSDIITPTKPKKVGGTMHKEGVFSPVVKVGKVLLGEDQINKLRAKIISLHSDVIKGFVETSETEFGQAILSALFEVTDANSDGKLDKDEVATALRSLGFSWLKDKQIEGILKRADFDENGYIDIEEFKMEAPKTLKTNLVKLAKKNGGDMGLLV